MKEIRQAIVLVDNYRRPSRQRNTNGRYRVGAKTEKEAEELVQKAIGFGSVQFYYWDDGNKSGYPIPRKVAYKEVVKEKFDSSIPGCRWLFEKPRHACAQIEDKL